MPKANHVEELLQPLKYLQLNSRPLERWFRWNPKALIDYVTRTMVTKKPAKLQLQPGNKFFVVHALNLDDVTRPLLMLEVLPAFARDFWWINCRLSRVISGTRQVRALNYAAVVHTKDVAEAVQLWGVPEESIWSWDVMQPTWSIETDYSVYGPFRYTRFVLTPDEQYLILSEGNGLSSSGRKKLVMVKETGYAQPATKLVTLCRKTTDIVAKKLNETGGSGGAVTRNSNGDAWKVTSRLARKVARISAAHFKAAILKPKRNLLKEALS